MARRDLTSFERARLGLARGKALPRRVYESARPIGAKADPEVWHGVRQERVEAMGSILRALDGLETHAERMNLLAAVAAVHEDPDEAVWLLHAGAEEEGARCGSCGRAHAFTRWRNRP